MECLVWSRVHQKTNWTIFHIFIDFKTNQFFLIRDRLGQKPLFYSLAEDEIIFGTNLKSIVSYLQKSEIDQKSLIDYIEFGVVPSPNTILRI